MNSPLEQFEILVLRPIILFGIDFSLTNSGLYSILVLATLGIFFYLGASKLFLVPGRWQNVVEGFYTFIYDMLRQQAGAKAIGMFPLVVLPFL